MGNKSFVKIASPYLPLVILPVVPQSDSRSVQDSKQVGETQAGQVQETQVEQVKETQSGQASFISEAFQGEKTASGEIF